MTDRTEAFISQVREFLKSGFSGEIKLQCVQGQVRKMKVTQYIDIVDSSTDEQETAY